MKRGSECELSFKGLLSVILQNQV